MDTLIIIKTTVNNIDVKKNIVDYLLNNKLASCINILNNISSTYLWEGKIVNDEEDILLIKTISNNETTVYKIIKKLHNYEVPEIVTFKDFNVENNYLNWVNKVTEAKNL
tara:strand:- start:321 stop:650 length:330 start_codon:yes stop_codon:yes gene_type:complete